MICRAGGLTQKFVMHMLQTMVKPALHLLYSSTIEESEPHTRLNTRPLAAGIHRP